MLYRHFDKKRRLLYVGISEDALKRAAQHGVKPWGGLIARITVEHFPTRGEAESAERAAILAEAPLFNIAHARQRPLAAPRQAPKLRGAPHTSIVKPAPKIAAKPLRFRGTPSQMVALELDLVQHLADLQRSILERALREYNGNQTAAGRRIGLSLRQMRYRMARLGLKIERADGRVPWGGK